MKIAMVGFGEVGKILSAGLIKQPGVDSISAWDLLFTNASQSQGQVEFAKENQITIVASLQETLHNADLVISAVTASNTFSVAKEVSQFIQQGSYFLDLNSASPGTKKECAQEIDQRGAFYVEAGVMTSVPPYGIKVPMLLGGEKAQALTEILLQWGMDAKTVSKELKDKPWHVEGTDNAEWVLMDYVSIVVHVFQKEIREYYNIEGLWGDAKITTLANKN